ncbi:MAG TPA: pyridoxamine 5'-phosphate oxidase family protein [Thermomicrobiaceae bacterium]|nr:pyridoxamine 5'-phosphate oxidase family protein [Thermomicrobiaceae bacterium]
MSEHQDRRLSRPSGPDRPRMPASYDVATGRDGLLDWDVVDAPLAAARNYWVASIRPDGRPHAVPVWGVWLDGTLYVDTVRRSRKARNLAANPGVVAHLESGDDAVILEGTVRAVTDPDELRRFAAAYAGKYGVTLTAASRGRGQRRAGAYALAPSVVLAWLERDFRRTPTRWRFVR